MVEKIRTLTFVIFLIWGMGKPGKIFSQDPFFSQFYAAPLQLNPAFAGLSNHSRFGAIYRNQWPLVDQAFRSYSSMHLSWDKHFDQYRSGLGAELLTDNAGAGFLRTFKVGLMYSYRVELNRRGHYIKGGVELGYVNLAYGWDKYIFGDQIDPKFGYTTPGGIPITSKEIRPLDTRIQYLDAGAGILYYSPSWFIGLSSKHLNGPQIGILQVNNNAFDGLPVRWTFHTGGSVDLTSPTGPMPVSLQPGLAFVKQSSFYQVNVGSQLIINKIFTGLWYRHARSNPDALIAVLGFRKGAFKMAYSFDFTVSSLTLGQGGSHEISLLYHPNNQTFSRNRVRCFEGFN